MFFTIFLDLCADKGVKPGRAADEMGINRSTVTSWKQQGYTPRGDNLNKVAQYFDVPSDLLLEQPPFDHWAEINMDRKGFFDSLNLDRNALLMIYGIDIRDPDAADLKSIAAFIKAHVDTVELNENGWNVTLKTPFLKEDVKIRKRIKEIPADIDIDGLSDMKRLLLSLLVSLNPAEDEKALAYFQGLLDNRKD